MKKNLLIPFLGISLTMLLISCVKDTDFDQAQEITLTPIVELDLIFFNIAAGDFYDSLTNTSILTLRDTTEIRFLDDSGTQESLVKAEFHFDFTNSIPREFQVDFQFLSENDEETFSTATNVAAGTPEMPISTQFLETVEALEIEQLTMANRAVVSVTIPSSDATLQGILNLKSKTTYYLEISEGTKLLCD